MKSLSRIPSGLIGKGTETVRINDEPYTIFKGKIHCFPTTPECRISLYRDHMQQHPEGERAMEKITGSKDILVKTKQWMLCRFGGMDDTPDISEQNIIQEAEYVPCPKRDTCPYKGIGCKKNVSINGVTLSKSELAVLKFIRLHDKEIADALFLSTETIKTHIQNILRRLDCSRSDLIHWATIKGII